MSEYEKIFSKRLRQVRIEKSLTMPQLAEKISVSKVAIHQFESGASRPSLDVFARLAEALGVSTDFLLGRTDDSRVHQIRKRPVDGQD